MQAVVHTLAERLKAVKIGALFSAHQGSRISLIQNLHKSPVRLAEAEIRATRNNCSA